MKIEQSKTFLLGEVLRKKILLVPAEKIHDLVKVAKDFIGAYESGNFHESAFSQSKNDARLTVALCTTLPSESWVEVAHEIKREGWSGASLAIWQLYTEDEKNIPANAVTLPGVRYRDDDLIEWVPIVRYQHRTFFKSATEVAMKLSSTLGQKEARIILVSKIEIEKK